MLQFKGLKYRMLVRCLMDNLEEDVLKGKFENLLAK